MLTIEFMSEIVRYERITLGRAEEHFLYLFATGPKSAYDIFSDLKSNPTFKTKPMAYKNVHRRVKRFQELGLVQEIHGVFRRKAKKYGLTSRGFFQFLLTGDPNDIWLLLDLHRDNIIIKTILYQFFETETINELTREMGFIAMSVGPIPNYLKKCCEAILKKVEQFRSKIKIYEDKKVSREQEVTAMGNIIWDMDDLIRREIIYLFFQIVTTLKNDAPDKEEPYPSWILAEDKKFIELLEEIKVDFDDGYRKLLVSK